jgi:hypothetical protein
LPRDWAGGRIKVDGDGAITPIKFLFACIVSALLWIAIVWVAYGVVG